MEAVSLCASYDSRNTYRILEVPAELRDEFLLNANSAELIGHRSTEGSAISEPTYLRSSHGVTYGVRKIEYSNSLVISRRRKRNSEPEQPETVPYEWVERCKRMFEVSACRPRTDVAIQSLKSNYLTLDELERCDTLPGTKRSVPTSTTAVSAQDGDACSFVSLARKSCSSHKQLRTALSREGAVVVDGRVRLLHPDVIAHVVDALVLYMDGNANPENVSASTPLLTTATTPAYPVLYLDDGCVLVDWSSVEAYFSGGLFPPLAVQVVCQRVTSPLQQTPPVTLHSAPPSCTVWRVLSVQSTLVYLALQTMKQLQLSAETSSEVRWVDRDTFTKRWRSKIPTRLVHGTLLRSIAASVATTTEQEKELESKESDELLTFLRGWILVRQVGSGVAITRDVAWCPHDSLSFVVDERVKQLFRYTFPARWEAPELKAYIEPILEPGQTFENAVSKVCREHRVPGKVISYSLLA